MKRIVSMIIVVTMLFGVTVYAAPVDDNTGFVAEQGGEGLVGLDSKIDNLRSNMAEISRYARYESNMNEFRLYQLVTLTSMYKNLFYLARLGDLANDADEWDSSQLPAISDKELMQWANEVRNLAGPFEAKFGASEGFLIEGSGANGEFVESELDSGFKGRLSGNIEGILTQVIPKMLGEIVNPILEEAEQGSQVNYNSIVDRYGETLFWSGELLNVLDSMKDDFKDIENLNMTAGKVRMMTRLKEYVAPTLEWTGFISASRLAKLRELADLTRMSRVSIETSPGGISVKEGLEYQIQALAEVERNADWDEDDFSVYAWMSKNGDTESVTLTSAYVAMLACTAVYVPFESKVGDADYLAALRSLVSSGQEDAIVDLFNNVKNKRKPLYTMSPDLVEKYTSRQWGASEPLADDGTDTILEGAAERVTLGDLVGYIENEESAILNTVKGRFELGEDMNSWVFYQTAASSGSGQALKSSTTLGEDTVIPAEQTASGEVYTKSLFELGSSPGTWAMSQLVFTNLYYNLRNTSFLEERKDHLLYMNVFGDIVLNDNTVVLPGAANPIIYSKDAAYNPYTAAFMNNYPRLAQDADTLRVQSKTDINKYMIFGYKDDLGGFINVAGSLAGQGANLVFAVGDMLWDTFVTGDRDAAGQHSQEIAEGSEQLQSDINDFVFRPAETAMNSFYLDYSILEIRKILAEDDFAPPTRRQSVSLYPFFYAGGGNAYMFTRAGANDNVDTWDIVNTDQRLASGETAITFEQAMTSGARTIFPYARDENTPSGDDSSTLNYADESVYEIPIAIAQNMYWYYMFDDNMELGSVHNQNLRAEYIFENVIVEMLQGNEQVVVYEKNVDLAGLLMGGADDETLNKFKDVANSLLDNVGEMDGVLGMVAADANPVFGHILHVVRDYFWVIFAVFAIIFIFRYMRRGGLLYIAAMSVASGVCLYLFAYVLPIYLPILYNAAGSMFTEGLVSDTVLYKAEKYSTTYGGADDLTSDNNYDIQTLSLTLYRMSEKQLREFAVEHTYDDLEQLRDVYPGYTNAELGDVMGPQAQSLYDAFRYGGRVIIDPEMGLFIQGDSLKVNVDVLFANNSIYSKPWKKAGDSFSHYRIFNDRYIPLVFDKYLPYFDLQSGFIETLNSMLYTYSIPRTTVNYLGGLTKDAYLMFNYTNSIPFLYPDNGFVEVAGLTPIELFKLEAAFPNPADFLGMTDWVNNPSDYQKQSIWYRAMVSEGYYDPYYGQERRDRLIDYVNYQTKRFLIENEPIVGIVSDENLIKITALQASFYFNSRISSFGNMVYPLGYNQEELKLNDVFLTALTANNERFIKHNFDLVEYVANGFGVVGVAFLIALLFFGLLFVTLVKFTIPIFYILLGVMVLLRMVIDLPVGELFKGYLKSTAAMIGVYTGFIITTVWIPQLVGGVMMLVVLAIVNLLLFFVTVVTLMGFLSDLGTMGNDGIGQALLRNPVTGLLAKPLGSLFNHLQKAVNAMPAAQHINNKYAEENRDYARLNRRFIIGSMDGRSVSHSSKDA